MLCYRKLLKRQISQRLGSGPADADPIKTHPFFKHISWADVISRKLDPPFKPVLTSDVRNIFLHRVNICGYMLGKKSNKAIKKLVSIYHI